MEFDASLLVIMAIFIIVWAMLKVFFFRPLLDVMEKRSAKIESAQEVYDRAFAKAEERLSEERAKLTAARRAATDRRDELRRDAQDQRRALLEKASAESQSALDEADRDLTATVESERAALESRVREIADRMTERLLGRAV